MKQINIFNEIDYIDAEGKIKRCLSCNKSIEKGKGGVGSKIRLKGDGRTVNN